MSADGPPELSTQRFALPPSRRYRRVLVWLFISVAMVVIASHAHFTSDLNAIMPDTDELRRPLAFFAERGATQIMAVEAWSSEPDGIAACKTVLHGLVRSLEGLSVKQISPGDGDSLTRFIDVVYERMPVLLTPEQLNDVRERMSGDKLALYLAALKQRASRPDDLLAATAARGDVLALAGAVMQRMQAHLPRGTADDDIIVHADGLHCLALFEVPFSPNDLQRTDRLMAICEQAARSAPATVHIEPIGSYRHFHDNFAGIQSALVTSMPISLVIIAVLLYSLLRSWRAVVALHMPAMLAFVGAVAILALVFDQVPLVMLGFGAGFIGIAIENAIHMTLALQMGEERHVIKPLIMSFLTTAVAFVALASSDIPPLRYLGVQVVAGLLLALSASLWLLPALVRRREHYDPWSPLSLRLIRWSEGPAATRIAIAVLLTALTVPGMFAIPALNHAGLRWLDDLKKMDGSKPETWAALEAFLKRWSEFETSNFLVAVAPDVDAALDQAARVRAELRVPPSVVEQLLPSRAEQERRLAAWNDLWREQAAPFAKELSFACRALGMRPEAFDDSLKRYRPVDHVEPVTLATWNDTPVAMLLAGLVQQTKDGWQAASPLNDVKPDEVQRAEEKLNASNDGSVWLASRRGMARGMVAIMRNDLAKRGLYMLGAMALLVIVMTRRVRHILAILVPPAVAIAWTYGLLGWLDVPMSPSSILTIAFVAGIGLDTAIFLAQGERRANALSPGLACAISTMVGVGSMISCQNPLLADVGKAVCIGMVACVVSCLLLTPAIYGKHAPEPAQ